MLLKVPRQKSQAKTPTVKNIPKASFFLYTRTINSVQRPSLILGFIWWLHVTSCYIHPESTLGSISDSVSEAILGQQLQGSA